MKPVFFKTLLCTSLVFSGMTFANEIQDRDAQEYANRNGVSIEEAKKALDIEMYKDNIIGLIENEYKGRLAGVYIEHHPTYKIVVKLKGNGKNQKKEMAVGNALPNVSVPIEFIYGAKATKEVAKGQLQKAQKLAQQYFDNVQIVSYNEKTGNIDIEVKGENNQQTQEKVNQLQKAWKNPHVDLHVVFVNYSVSVMSAVAHGGTPIVDKTVQIDGKFPVCTTGFGIKDSKGNKYMSTAAHCPNNFEDNSGVKYTFVGEIPYAKGNDLQWNATTATIGNKFRDGATTTRTLTGRRTLSKTTVGDQVCHYGRSTGYSCGAVEAVGLSVAQLDAQNADKYPGNFWVRVKTPTCAEGDSGGPAFTARTIASGIVSLQLSDNATKKCVGYLYLPTDKIYENGFSLIY